MKLSLLEANKFSNDEILLADNIITFDFKNIKNKSESISISVNLCIELTYNIPLQRLIRDIESWIGSSINHSNLFLNGDIQPAIINCKKVLTNIELRLSHKEIEKLLHTIIIAKSILSESDKDSMEKILDLKILLDEFKEIYKDELYNKK